MRGRLEDAHHGQSVCAERLPLPGAIVYVPNGAATSPYGVTSIQSGVANGGTCEQWNQRASGSPLVSTTSAFDGSFTLDDVPAGIDFPVVVQLGKWRRMVTIPAVTRCTTRTLAPDQNQCVSPNCTAKSCTELGVECGPTADTCCVDACKPRTCADAAETCGSVANGCGGLIDCGKCRPNETCGLNGHANQCGGGGPN